jgi:cellulose synthase/poly-beta-1,6-N-acetylglucosamine synthase-like glycosyltransferase
MHAASKTNEDSRNETAVANGQFFLIRRSAYEAVGGHEAVKDQITEDVELMRRLKGSDFKVRIFMGAHLAATRMHSNLRQMFNGWSRIYSGTPRRRPWKILWAMWFILSAILTVYPALAWGIHAAVSDHNFNWIEVSMVHFVLMTLYLMLIYHWSGNRSRFAFLIPISSLVMLAIFVYSLRKCQTGRIVWRDTVFAPESV